MLNKLKLLLLFSPLVTFGQVTMEFNIQLFTDTKTFDGEITICNSSSESLLGGYSFKALWPTVQSINYGLILSKSGNDNCDSATLSLPEWTSISAGTCKTIEIGGEYLPPFFTPPKAKGTDGKIFSLIHSPNSYIPSAENAGSPTPEFYFDPNCFIPTSKEIHLGEATLLEWGVATDMFIPENKKQWALANAHAHTLFNNLAGKELFSINHFNATALNESHCGCESDIINDPAATNPLSFQGLSMADGCFQVTPTGWLQISQFFPQLTEGLAHSNIISGNYSRSCIIRAYYDMTSLLYWEKAKCFNPIEMFESTNDPYLAEELFGMAFYQGFDEGIYNTIFNTKREVYIQSENAMETMYANQDGGFPNYGMRQRNNTKQLDNNTNASWAINSMYYDPGVYKWRGWYNDDINWADVETYINEIKLLWSDVNWHALTASTQITFNEINNGNPVPFMQIGPVIDHLVLHLPAYDGNEGMAEIYKTDIDKCPSAGISITTCTTLCPGEEGEITVNLMGTPPFEYVIHGPNGELYQDDNIQGSPVVLNVSDPGIYKIVDFSDANSSPFINCHFSKTEVLNSGTDDVFWDESVLNEEYNCSLGELKLVGTGSGPWTINYEHEGEMQETITFHSSPYVIDENPSHGNYKITRMIAGGCDAPNNSEIKICNTVGTNETIKSLLNIWPNPVSKTLYIDGFSSDELISIYSLDGKLIKRDHYNHLGIDVSNLKQAIYILQVGNRYAKFLIK